MYVALLLRHWKRAECSESMGMRRTPAFLTAAVTSAPAATKVSLFARAMFLPAAMAFRVGPMPTAPTTAVTTVSAAASVAMRAAPSGPPKTLVEEGTRPRSLSAAWASASATAAGANSAACLARTIELWVDSQPQPAKRSFPAGMCFRAVSKTLSFSV